MVRIGHIADTHLGAGAKAQRVDEIAQSFRRAVQAMEADDAVDVIIIAGDVFDAARPSYNMMAWFIKTMRETTKPVMVIAGNHDTVRVRTSGSIWEVLEPAMPSNVNLGYGYVSSYVTVEELNAFFVLTPWGAVTDPTDMRRRAEILQDTDQNMAKVWITHGIADGVQGAVAAFSDSIIKEDEMAQYDYVALGDLHAEGQVQPNAWYSGSTDRMSWSDFEAHPHWLLVDVEAEKIPRVTAYELSVRPMKVLTADVSNLQGPEAIEAVADAVADLDAGTHYTLVLDGANREVRREVNRWLKQNNVPMRVSFTAELASTEMVHEVSKEDLKKDVPSLKELFNQFMTKRTEDGVYTPEFAERMRLQGGEALDHAMAMREQDAGAIQIDPEAV